MAILFADRVRCLTATTGTGTLHLGTAVPGYQTFASAVTSGQLLSGCNVYYVLQEGLNWECGTGLYTAGSPDTLTRSVASSSSGTTAISLAGYGQVAVTLTAQFAQLAAGAAPAANPALSGIITVSSGNLALSNTPSNVISFAPLSLDLGPPTQTSRSTGTRIVLSPTLSATAVDVALGLDVNTMWFSTATNSATFVWYAGITQVGQIGGTGAAFVSNGMNGVVGPNTPSAGTFTSLQSLTPVAGDSSTQVATTAFVAPLMANTGRNRLHNGRMQVIQRGTSFAIAANTQAYCADRWIAGGPNPTVACNVGISSTTGYGSAPNYLHLTGTFTAISQYLQVFQRLEAADSMDLASQTVTVSFYASGSVANGTFDVNIFCNYVTGTADNWANYTTSLVATIGITATVQRLQVTFAVPSAATLGLELLLQFILISGTGGAASFNISNIQMEISSKASAPETHNLSYELVNCQRFYQVVSLNCRQYFSSTTGNTEVYVGFRRMRSAPTAVFISGSTSNVATSFPQFPIQGVESMRFVLAAQAAGDCYALNMTYSLSADL